MTETGDPGTNKTEFVLDGPTNNAKADRKRAHRKMKHKLINDRIALLRQTYTGQSAAQRASEARIYADRELALR